MISLSCIAMQRICSQTYWVWSTVDDCKRRFLSHKSTSEKSRSVLGSPRLRLICRTTCFRQTRWKHTAVLHLSRLLGQQPAQWPRSSHRFQFQYLVLFSVQPAGLFPEIRLSSGSRLMHKCHFHRQCYSWLRTAWTVCNLSSHGSRSQMLACIRRYNRVEPPHYICLSPQ